MIISDRFRFVYIGLPRTASTTLHEWLSQPTFCDARGPLHGCPKHATEIPENARGHFVFASVRHPFDRAVSLWMHSQTPSALSTDTRPMSFSEFAGDFQAHASWVYRQGQAELLARIDLDAIVRVDRLNEDLLRLPPITAAIRSGLTLEPLQQLNATAHPPWQDVVDAQSAETIVRRWRDDFALYMSAEPRFERATQAREHEPASEYASGFRTPSHVLQRDESLLKTTLGPKEE